MCGIHGVQSQSVLIDFVWKQSQWRRMRLVQLKALLPPFSCNTYCLAINSYLKKLESSQSYRLRQMPINPRLNSNIFREGFLQLCIHIYKYKISNLPGGRGGGRV